jgi:hypothetical protein
MGFPFFHVKKKTLPGAMILRNLQAVKKGEYLLFWRRDSPPVIVLGTMSGAVFKKCHDTPDFFCHVTQR